MKYPIPKFSIWLDKKWQWFLLLYSKYAKFHKSEERTAAMKKFCSVMSKELKKIFKMKYIFYRHHNRRTLLRKRKQKLEVVPPQAGTALLVMCLTSPTRCCRRRHARASLESMSLCHTWKRIACCLRWLSLNYMWVKIFKWKRRKKVFYLILYSILWYASL